MSAQTGLIAEFDRAEALTDAVQAAKREGYAQLDAFSPFPLREIEAELGLKAALLPWIALAAAIIGGGLQYYAQYWMNAVDYPLNIGGRPLHSWPMFIPTTIIVSFLWAGVATFVYTAVTTGLPRPHHPVFDVPGFDRASSDRFFLLIERDDPRFDEEKTRRFLEALAPRAVHEVSP
jgi:hypothetical protein